MPPPSLPAVPPVPLILRVAVAAPLAGLFDYLPPAAAAQDGLIPGVRLLVPFGRGRRVGILVETAADSAQDAARLKSVIAQLDPLPVLAAADLTLIRWAADYYRQPLGEALFSALPVRLRRPDAPLEEGVPGLRATAAGCALDLAELGRAAGQRRILEVLRAAPPGLATGILKAQLGPATVPLKVLRERGLIEPCRVPAAECDAPAIPDPTGPDLNPEQAQAVAAVLGAGTGFTPFLLDGVTGSGSSWAITDFRRAAS